MLLWVKTNAAPVKPMLTPFQRLVLSSIDAIALGLVSSCLLLVQRAESVNLSPNTGRVDLAVLRVPLVISGLEVQIWSFVFVAKSGRFVDAIWALGVDW